MSAIVAGKVDGPVHLGDLFLYRPARADDLVEVVREVTVELRTPLTSMENVTRQLFRDLMPFMRRTDGIALKGFTVQRDIVIAQVEIVRPMERKE